MKIEIQSYTPDYKSGVLKCLRNNYPWMAQENDENLYRWCQPFLEYNWAQELSGDAEIFKHGMILLENGKVVGYLGFIFANRIWKGRKYLSQSGTTWAINEGYRIYMFKALKKAYSLADVLLDFTPRKSVEKSLVNIFNFKYIDHYVYRFYPIPCIHESLTYREIINDIDLDDPVLRTEFHDHKPYGVRCIQISDGHEKSYLFFRINQRIRKHRKIFRKRRSILKILKLTNPDFFCKHYREIVWHLQKGEHPYVQLEPRFIAPHKLQGFGIKEKSVVRLGLDKTGIQVPMDLLYSEEAILP